MKLTRLLLVGAVLAVLAVFFFRPSRIDQASGSSEDYQCLVDLNNTLADDSAWQDLMQLVAEHRVGIQFDEAVMDRDQAHATTSYHDTPAGANVILKLNWRSFCTDQRQSPKMLGIAIAHEHQHVRDYLAGMFPHLKSGITLDEDGKRLAGKEMLVAEKRAYVTMCAYLYPTAPELENCRASAGSEVVHMIADRLAEKYLTIFGPSFVQGVREAEQEESSKVKPYPPG